MPLDTWYELVVANAFYDQAGYELLSDVYHSTTFGPWKRALAKVDKEETFHLRHGQQWIRRLAPDPAELAKLQRAADWMFMLTVEWFGLPDSEKRHTEQLDYGFKGRSNDTLRQAWMSKVVPFCEEVGLKVPAHLDAAIGQLRARRPVPGALRRAERSAGCSRTAPIGWDQVLDALERPRPDERRVRRQRSSAAGRPVATCPTRSDRAMRADDCAATTARPRRLWSALREVEDPEIPVSLVDMGLIVSIDYRPLENSGKPEDHLYGHGLPGDGHDPGRHPRPPAARARRRRASTSTSSGIPSGRTVA